MIETEPERKRALRGFASFAPGESGDLGSVTIDQEAVTAFAREWDPQPFHLDEAAARASPLGGLAASGWHTGSLLMRMIADGLLAGTKSMGSGGLRELKWSRPALIGARLTGRYAVTAVRPSSRGDRGYVDFDFALVGEDGTPVTSFRSTVIVGA